MSRSDHLALAFAGIAILAALFVGRFVFEEIPHIEDEVAYVWQANAAALGRITMPSPPSPKSFLFPFVVDYNGQRFSKYPPGWGTLLGIGVRLGLRSWINPLLAGLGLWLTYRLGKKLFDEKTALLAAALTLTSPFFLMNSGSLLSHAWTFVLTLSFALAWLDLFSEKREFKIDAILVSVAGLSLGCLAITRPLTAIGISLPFFIHGLTLLRDRARRIRVLIIGAIALLIGSLFFVWQFAVTGNFLVNPYTLWWSYDTIGLGPGIGDQPSGHTLRLAWDNLLVSLNQGWRDFFGWGNISWLFLPFGMIAAINKRSAWATLAIFPSLVIVYMIYWIGSWIVGPRYYYEGFMSLTLLTSAGISWLYLQWHGIRKYAVALLVVLLVGYNVFAYLPPRLGSLHGLYGHERAKMSPFLTSAAQALTPALVIVYVEKDWSDYGTLLELENLELTSPFIFAVYRSNADNAELMKAFPDRTIIHYHPSKPYTFDTEP